MAKTYNRLDIEFNKDVNDIITAVQNDTLSRYLDVSLFSNGMPINLTDHTVRIYMVKPDNTEIFNDGEITDAINGRVQFELTTQALTVCGNLQTQIIVFDNEEREILSTKIFNILITESLKNENSVESSNEYGALVILFQNIYEALQLMTEVSQKLGLPTDKLEALNLTTMYEVLDYLINTVEENSTVAVQGKLNEIDAKIEKLEKTIEDYNMDYLELPNLNYGEMILINHKVDENYNTIVNVTGKGYLVAAILEYGVRNSVKNIRGIKITIDGQVIYWQELNAVLGAENGERMNNTMGISNLQNSTSMYGERFSYHPKVEYRIGTNTRVQTSNTHKISKLSSSKVNVSSYISKFEEVDTTKVLNSKGLRFEKSLKLEIRYDSQVTSSFFRYLYSLDD
ncbi:MAG: phage baseplate upper protein [Eubacteriales bacterium]|nr:phage baseplate upper protein [Eubacteriales bacterium]